MYPNPYDCAHYVAYLIVETIKLIPLRCGNSTPFLMTKLQTILQFADVYGFTWSQKHR